MLSLRLPGGRGLPRTRGARRAVKTAPDQARAPRVRLWAALLVAALAALGPILEGSLGDGLGWTIGLVILMLVPSLARAGGPRFHPLDPETYVPVTYFLSVAYTPVLRLLMSSTLHLSSRDEAAMEVAYAGAAGCALVCTALSRPPEAPNLERLVPMQKPKAILDQDWGNMVVGVLGLGLVFAWIASIGVRRFFTLSYADTYLEGFGKGILISGWYLIQLAAVYFFLRFASLRKARLRVPTLVSVAGASFLLSFLIYTATGRRGALIFAVASVGLGLHAFGIQIRRLWLAIGVVCAIFYGIAIDGFRFKQGSGLDAQLESAAARLEQTENVLDIVELQRVYDNLASIVNEKPPLVNYPGESWINAVLILVPSPLWQDRPLALSQRYVMWKDPDFARSGGGYAMSAAAEGYLNFGLVGTFIQISMMCGVFFMLPLVVAAARETSLLGRATGACLASFAYNQFRGELTALLKITLTLGIGVLVALVTASFVKHLRRKLAAMGTVRHGPERPLRHARLGQPSSSGP
ncbi:O-antigen polysaccharide polymerase Wzy [Sorangium sp. So ce385]|uniref:O-antigen polysaccharide polymerase Wzy n=1 Tax=Sorangium sp. So ce385 TaxID=3133308 RepID=UPI003F5C7FF1